MRGDAGDYTLMVRWLNEPHVCEWWDYDEPPMTLEQAVADYRECTLPGGSTTACIIEYDGRPIGYCQFYPWSDEVDSAREIGFEPQPGWWGLDIFIGEPELTGQGLGARASILLSKYLKKNHGAAAVALTTSVENKRAIGAYEKAGFRRQAHVLDTDTKYGRRVPSWLMVSDLESI
jgi:aminoglycoside 6'-N-acetyltransferase